MVKAMLRHEKDLGQHVKSDLYSHLTEVFSKIIQNHKYDAIDKFEEISNLVKQTNIKFADPKFDYEIQAQAAGSKNKISNQEALLFIEKAKKLIQEKVDVGVSTSDKALLTKNVNFNIPNIAEQAAMLEWAGIDFGPESNYMLQKSLKRLATLSGALTIKFFGKIYGTQKDYWVAQGTLGFSEEGITSPNQEARGQGINANVYWVADNLLQDWIQLPDALPEQVQAACAIKHVFTGNLNGKIDSCPPFPGKERHLLRVQLARITHATELSPKGVFEIDAETEQVKLAEEAPALRVEDLKSLEAWAHQHPNILKVGRCSHAAPAGMADEEKEELMAKLAEDDKVEERFRALQEDTPMPGLETAWTSKVCGDNQ